MTLRTFPGLKVKDHPSIPLPTEPHSEIDYDFAHADIRVVGIGDFGASIACELAKVVPGIKVHEVRCEKLDLLSESASLFLSAVSRSDFLFLLSALDEECASLAGRIGAIACQEGIPTAVVTTSTLDLTPSRHPKWHDVVLMSEVLGVRHCLETLASILTHRSIVGVDFQDVVEICRSGQYGYVGVGRAVGESCGETAAIAALKMVDAQGCALGTPVGVLVCVAGSPGTTIEDFDNAINVVKDAFSSDSAPRLIPALVHTAGVQYSITVTVISIYRPKSAPD